MEHQKRIGVRYACPRTIDAAGADSGRQLLLLRRPRAEVVQHATNNLPKILAIPAGLKCCFRTRSLRDRCIDIASNEGKCIELGSRVREHHNVGTTYEPLTADQIKPSLPGFDDILTSTTLGQYRKRRNKKNSRYTPAQSEYLQWHYKRGALDKDKRIPLQQVYDNMKKMREHGTGRYAFSRRENNFNGQVVSTERMKQWFSGRKAAQGMLPIDPRQAYWKAHKIDLLRAYVGGDTTGKKKEELAQVMFEREAASNDQRGVLDGVYYNTPPP